jgi:hypothetical protein
VLSLVFQQGQHGLVAPVNAIKVANGQRTSWCESVVTVAAKKFHMSDYRFVPEPLSEQGTRPNNSIACMSSFHCILKW